MLVVLCRSTASLAREKSCAFAALIRRIRIASCDQSKDNNETKSFTTEGDSMDNSRTTGENDAKEKLNSLLKEMMKDGPLTSQSVEGRIELAKPKRIKKQKPTKDQTGDAPPADVIDEKLVEATKNVAKSMGRDVKETESELLNKLLSTKGSANLSELIGGMVIEHSDASKTSKEWSKIRREQGQLGRPMKNFFEGKRQPKLSRGPSTTVDLFGGPRLGIFVEEKSTSKKDQDTSPSPLRVWEMLEEREIHLATLHPPRNYFQQMILWTEQGKLWKFPIDNEQGLEEENKVFFTEHVFLEKHLDPWCPKKGPVRHFMELVCVGLSKNPYLTVNEKKSHIQWYSDYFSAKKDILKEVGALPE